MKTKILMRIFVSSVMFSGCTLMTAETPNSNIVPVTSLTIGVPENDISITNKKVIGVTMYYTATTKKGVRYQCKDESFAVMGNVGSPMCDKVSSK